MSSIESRFRLAMGCLLAAIARSSATAQEIPFYYPPPAPGSVTVTRGIQFGRSDTLALRMDVFRPKNGTGRMPVLVIFYGGVGASRVNGFSDGWGNAAASKGIVAVSPDIRQERAPEDFRQLIDYVYENASTFGGDRNAIAVYAPSGNVFSALPLVEDPSQTKVKAAAMYYGTGPVTTFRRDLPILFVRAGLDRPGVNGNERSGIVAMIASAIAQNAPVTVVNNPAGHHAFEMFDEGQATRDVIDQTLDFVKRATSAEYQRHFAKQCRRRVPRQTSSAAITGLRRRPMQRF